MRRGGFTLLEVMVALAILAGALVATSDIVSGALRNHVRAQHLEVATLLARGKMASLEEHYEWKGFRITDEDDEGTFEGDGHPEVRWQLAVKVPPSASRRPSTWTFVNPALPGSSRLPTSRSLKLPNCVLARRRRSSAFFSPEKRRWSSLSSSSGLRATPTAAGAHSAHHERCSKSMAIRQVAWRRAAVS